MENSHYQENLLTHVPIDEAIVLQKPWSTLV